MQFKEGQFVKLIDAEGAGIPIEQCPNGTTMILREQDMCGKTPCWKGYYQDGLDYWWVDETRIEPLNDQKGAI